MKKNILKKKLFSDITKASFADLLDTSELEILLQHLKKNKNKTLKFTPEHASPISLNRTNAKQKNINVELKSIKYKIEIITKRPVVTEKLENDYRALPTLSSVIKFWNMYMKSNPKSSKEYYNNEITTKKVTPEPQHAMYSEEAESISKVLTNLVSNKDTNTDQRSERQLLKDNNRFFNYQLNSEPYSNDRNKNLNKNGLPNQKSTFQEPLNFGAPHDLSFKGLVQNIHKLFSKPQMGNENKLTRIEINTPENKPNKQDDVYEQRPQNEADYLKHNEDENVLNSNPLSRHLNLLKSLLNNFKMNKFENNGDITATIARLEQLEKNEACSPLTTLPLKGNLSEDRKVPPSPLTGLMYDIMNVATTTHSMENMDYFEDNTEHHQNLLQQYNPALEKNMNYFEQTTEYYEKFIQEYNARPEPRIIYLKRTTEEPQKYTQQFESQSLKIDNFSEQNTEQNQKLIHHNAPPVKIINYFEPYIEQPETFIQHYGLSQNAETQSFVDDLTNSYKVTQSSSPQRLPLKEFVYTTPTLSTAINNEKFLHPDVMKEIAESVKKLVLNDIQDRILVITQPTITTEITTTSPSKPIINSNIAYINNQLIPNAITVTPTKLQLKNATTTLNNSPKDKTQNNSTTAGKKIYLIPNINILLE